MARETPWQAAQRRAANVRRVEERRAGYRASAHEESFMKKLRAAQRSLQSFQRGLDTWKSSLRHRRSDDGRLESFYVLATSPIPEEVDSDLASCVESLRSALDQLVYALSQRAAGPLTREQERLTAFPIWRIAPHSNDARAWRALSLLSDKARSSIQKLQPYSAFPSEPSASPLWLLTELSERSKHRENLVSAAAIGVDELKIGNGYIDEFLGGGGRIVPGEELLVLARSRRNRADMNWSVSLRYILDAPGTAGDRRDPTTVLAELVQYVDAVVIERLLPRLWD